jgi:hypothetical protein
MVKRGPRRSALLGLVALAVSAAAIVGVSNAGTKSTSLHGHMLGITHFGCASKTGICSKFTATGDFKGDGVVFIDTYPSPEGLSNAHTVIHTKKGDVMCSETAIFDLVGNDHPFVDLCLITDGTGIYDGATGYIQEVGTFDFPSDLGELEYYGKLTRAD